jgi:hypothetical protein
VQADVRQRCQALSIIKKVVKDAGQKRCREGALSPEILGSASDDLNLERDVRLLLKPPLELPSHCRRGLDAEDLHSVTGQHQRDTARSGANVKDFPGLESMV